jgi:hypothetical protein
MGQVRVRVGLGELAVDAGGLLDGGQGFLAPPQVGQAKGLVIQRGGQVRQVRARAVLGELAADGNGPLDRGQGFLAPPQVG